MAQDSLEYIINHLFLPPRLPQKDDYDQWNSRALIDTCLAGLKDFLDYIPEQERSQWMSLVLMLQNMQKVRDDRGNLLRGELISTIERMDIGDVFALHIVAQNAGLVIRRTAHSYLFELFELSPKSADVMTTKGRLVRHFPGPAVTVSSEQIQDLTFLEELGDCISKLDQETPKEALPTTRKAKKSHTEFRDTTDPRFVTEMLVCILRAVGTPHDATRICKRTRDDVLWNATLIPWRRSPMWLLLRVTIQTTLATSDPVAGCDRYKRFILFLLSSILSKAGAARKSSDLLYSMTAKVIRRSVKVHEPDGTALLKFVNTQVEKLKGILTQRWESLRVGPGPPPSWKNWISSRRCSLADTRLGLESLKPYLQSTAARESSHVDDAPDLKHLPRIGIGPLGLPILPRRETEEEERSCLAQLELWTQTDLPTWVKQNLESDKSCEALASLLDTYLSVAPPLYGRKSEDTSRMFLTSIVLWVAFDQCACRRCPLLRDYDPLLPEDLFDPLLLSKKAQLEQLDTVEQYLTGRRKAAKANYPCIFSSIDSPNSFAVRYFDESPEHQKLLEKIVGEANRKRRHKIEEFQKKQQEYDDLIEEVGAMGCDYKDKWNKRRTRSHPSHRGSCRKCEKESRAKNLKIEVHEWPLPEDRNIAKSIVFYLDPPSCPFTWLQTTFDILRTHFSPPSILKVQSQGVYTLGWYDGLRDFSHGRHGCLQPASSLKPVVKSHYGVKIISKTKEVDICVPNGMSYEMYDSDLSNLAYKFLGKCDIQNQCTIAFEGDAYKSLEYAKETTGYAPNKVISDQTNCSTSLSLHEYYAFGSLRAGYRLQWHNLARELVGQVINFNHKEVSILVAHAIYQAGPRGDGGVHRASHFALKDEGFVLNLMSLLGKTLKSIEENWQCIATLRNIIVIATRVLSVIPFERAREQSFRFLRNARSVAQRWSRELSIQRQEALGDGANELSVLTLESALAFFGTFDVELEYLPSLLSTDDDFADIFENSITINDRCPSDISSLPTSTKGLLYRHWRISQHIEPFLLNLVSRIQDALHCAVSRIWAGYIRGTSWKIVDPGEPWLLTQTSVDTGSKPVHYNVRSGQLLVQGLPLARLPTKYESHSTYTRLFGKRIFEVVPSTMPGMRFGSRSEVFGHQVHFALHDENLIVRVVKGAQIYEILPKKATNGDFPPALVNDYVHWLDTATGIVEWRLLSDYWNQRSCHWKLEHSDDGNRYLDDGLSRLVDLRSQTAEAVAALLAPLESPDHIHTTFHVEEKSISVHLPRLKLDFSLSPNATELKSKQFRDMFVDEDQEFGTLTGLATKLVLRNRLGSSRIVLIPDGAVSWVQHGNHVRVNIGTDLAKRVSYFCYPIDSQLGRLVDNGTLRGKLFQCYLHALTSHCLPDKLTGLTGTEQALQILSAASTLSQTAPAEADSDLLLKIAGLTPSRKFYPQHLKVMQQVGWKELPALSQHNSFYRLIKAFCQSVMEFSAFQVIRDLNFTDKQFGIGDQDLLERTSIRDSVYYVDGFGAEHQTAKEDSTYSPRDTPSATDRESRTYRTANLVQQWSERLSVSHRLLEDIKGWQQPLRGADHDDCDVRLAYDTRWLESPRLIFPLDFLPLCRSLSRTRMDNDQYKVMFFLSTLAYSEHANQQLVETLLAFATVDELRLLMQPAHETFSLGDGFGPNRATLEQLVESCVKDYTQCPECRLPQLADETAYKADKRRKEIYEAKCDRLVGEFVDKLISKWPVPAVKEPAAGEISKYISVPRALKQVQPKFASWYANYNFKDFIKKVQDELDSLTCDDDTTAGHYSIPLPVDNYLFPRSCVRFEDMLQNAPPETLPAETDPSISWLSTSIGEMPEFSRLDSLLMQLSQEATKGYESDYARELMSSSRSLRNLEGGLRSSKRLLVAKPQRLIQEYLSRCQIHVDRYYNSIVGELRSSNSQKEQMVVTSPLGPRISPTRLLEMLSAHKVEKLSRGWRTVLIGYGLAISALQRAQRMLNHITSDFELLREIMNNGHEGWDPMERPDWLLFEIENNIMIRPAQARIAQHMICPPSGSNSVMQLNMGEGKSSVIVPIVAAALADCDKLARVVVLKPLAKQMFHLLAKKLGGLLNRRIYQIPISRDLKPDMLRSASIRNLFDKCRRNRGILLVQPEHILSFELMGIDQLLSGRTELGNDLIDTQRWLNTVSRDILDESDEILSVKFELIYTMGTQRDLEFTPQRWEIIEHVLGLANRFSKDISKRLPLGIEAVPVSGGSNLHRIRLLRDDTGQELQNLVARDICDTGIPGLPVWSHSPAARNMLYQFLTDINTCEEDIQQFQTLALKDEDDAVRNSLLLLRGLLAGGILKFVLTHKRWRVNYGLDPSREPPTTSAVPYRAKDTPATRAEFSHPDVTIILTCLSCYYDGLSDSQLHDAFEQLGLSDNADEEYKLWVEGATDLPPACRQLKGVNLKDSKLCTQNLFPALRFSKRAIDFYLGRLVFPKEMKEFPNKLSSSGWNLARKKSHPTTGFSGTNDSKYLLPLSTEQCELDEQLHTNAMQLDSVLRAENSVQAVIPGYETLDARSLLQLVVESEPAIRVILDAGAQVLELRNEDVAEQWLNSVSASCARAVVYFDEGDEPSVLSRDGFKEPLIMSPFASQMGQCLVYLDEAHTRGTDLALPTEYRAAVTLGPNLTKDRLVQACMRMRKLGQGQSVVFCASADIQRKILSHSDKGPSDRVEVEDVLKWSIGETHIDTRKNCALWATQGLRYQRQDVILSKAPQGGRGRFPAEFAQSLLEKEAKTIFERYGGNKSTYKEGLLAGHIGGDLLANRKKQVDAIREKCSKFEIASMNSAALQEEQERELSPENEQERQVQRPAGLDPAAHSMHNDVTRFLTSGKLSRSSNAFQPAFESLRSTAAAGLFQSDEWPKDLLVTVDFANTIKSPKNELLNDYLRPVNWVASSKADEKTNLVVLSPFEANFAIALVQKHGRVCLHVYTARSSGNMRSTENLSFCPISSMRPPLPESGQIMQLNIFAGQLYLRTYDEYLALCRFLGVCFEPPKSGNIRVLELGFVDPADREKYDKVMALRCPFSKSPLPFIRELIGYRRKGLGYSKSHMGAILNGELLKREQFEE